MGCKYGPWLFSGTGLFTLIPASAAATAATGRAEMTPHQIAVLLGSLDTTGANLKIDGVGGPRRTEHLSTISNRSARPIDLGRDAGPDRSAATGLARVPPG